MGSMIDLPKGHSPSLALVHPTDDEKLIQFNLNGAEWSGALSLPAYLRREETLSQQALTRDGGITYWILIDTSLDGNPLDPASGTRLPLASCETYRKRALVWQDGKLQESVCHAIGSVFCASHLRKRGYAQRMMQELSKILRTYQRSDDRDCLFSVLYSDIGKKFYSGFGWEPFNSSHIAIPPSTSPAVEGLPTTRPLYEKDLEELCAIDVSMLRKSLESRTKTSNTAVALIPDIDVIRWHHAREDFVGMELYGKKPEVRGAIVGTEVGKRVWCYWTRMWSSEAQSHTLHILRLVLEEQGHGETAHQANGDSAPQYQDLAIAALMAVAQKQAAEWHMAHVEIWNPHNATVTAAQRLHPSAKVVDRDAESIASLQWFPEHDKPVADKIDWISNEKYAWC